MRSLSFLTVNSILVLTVACPTAYAQSARQVAQQVFPSVVLLMMEDINGHPLSLGSGFFVSKGVVATNLHVVEGAARGYAKPVGQRTKHDIAGIVGIDAARDLVLLSLTGATAPWLTLADSNQIAVGDEVYAVGNPQGLEGTFSQGIVSGVRQIGSDTLIQITAPISPGSSGGPVLNAQGRVIGVAVATFKGGQNLNFAIPASYLGLLLSSMRPAARLASRVVPGQQSSILNDLGGPSTEGVVGGQFTWAWVKEGSIGEYSFSLRNLLREPVRDVYCLVAFFDRDGNPIDVDLVHYPGVIPAGFAKRIKGQVDVSVQKLTTPLGSSAPSTKLEFRVLDFKIEE